MKTYPIILTAAATMMLVAGCSKAPVETLDGEPVTVTLNLTGDFDVDVDQDPITKATSSNDAYAINVYYDKEGDGTRNDIYAYGLFDNVADMTITLLSNHVYKVVCSLVKDAKTTLYYGQAFNNTYSGYAYPFQTTASNSTLINNQFVIGTSTYFSGLTSSKSHIASTTSPSTSNYTTYPKTNRFYGETDNYSPVPNGTIDIYLKRIVFGAKFVVTGLSEGTLKVTCGDFYSASYTKDSEGTEYIYTFPSVRDVWLNDTPLVATTSLTYTSSRGNLWDISTSQSVQFKRNVMTTVSINMSPDKSGAYFTITEEDLGEVNNIDLGINTDGLIDIIVNPES